MKSCDWWRCGHDVPLGDPVKARTLFDRAQELKRREAPARGWLVPAVPQVVNPALNAGLR